MFKVSLLCPHSLSQVGLLGKWTPRQSVAAGCLSGSTLGTKNMAGAKGSERGPEMRPRPFSTVLRGAGVARPACPAALCPWVWALLWGGDSAAETVSGGLMLLSRMSSCFNIKGLKKGQSLP